MTYGPQTCVTRVISRATAVIHERVSPVKVLQVILLSPPLSGYGRQKVATAALTLSIGKIEILNYVTDIFMFFYFFFLRHKQSKVSYYDVLSVTAVIINTSRNSNFPFCCLSSVCRKVNVICTDFLSGHIKLKKRFEGDLARDMGFNSLVKLRHTLWIHIDLSNVFFHSSPPFILDSFELICIILTLPNDVKGCPSYPFVK